MLQTTRRVNRTPLILFCVLMLLGKIHAQSVPGDSLIGTWALAGLPKILSNDTLSDWRTEPVDQDVVKFYADGIFEIESGMFFSTPQYWSEYRFPWIYCGNFSYYRLIGEHLEIYNPCYKKWIQFKIDSLEGNKVTLMGMDTLFTLTKLKVDNLSLKRITIKKIELKISDMRFFVGKRIVLEENGRLTVYYENALNKGKILKAKLPPGYFSYVSNKIVSNNLWNLSSLYDQTVDGRSIKLKLIAKEGEKTIQSEGYLPDEIKRTLVPLIYVEDLLNYPELWYKVDFNRY